MLALHIAVDEEQTNVPVKNRRAAFDQYDGIVVDIGLHTVTGDAHGKVRLRIRSDLIILIIITKRRRGISGRCRCHIKRDDLIALRLTLCSLQTRTLGIEQLQRHKAAVIIQTAQLPERLPLLRCRLTGAARTAKRLKRNMQRIADAQQQLEIDLHIVAADNAVERLCRHFDLPRELVDLDLAFIQQIFERGSDHTQHLFGLIITNLPFYVKE